jgi:methylthioribose-1-phosphate isomerase
METIQPLIWEGTALKLLDQRLLPDKEIYLECRTLDEIVKSIQRMVVRGAPAIGITAAFGMVIAAREIISAMVDSFFWPKFQSSLQDAANALQKTRPTAVNLTWGINRMLQKVSTLKNFPPALVLKEMEKEAIEIFEEDIAINKKIGELGATLISPGSRILTHCNAGALATAGYGTALGVVRSAYFQGKNITVYANETRPFLQGSRLTAWELQKEGIPVTVIVDGAAGYFIAQKEIDCIIVGADRVAANGDVANKIGTYTMAVLARENNLPFYVAAPFSTLDPLISSGQEIIVEEREPSEVTSFRGRRLTPSGISAKNPAFDITPSTLITALITEYGIIYYPTKNKISNFFADVAGKEG